MGKVNKVERQSVTFDAAKFQAMLADPRVRAMVERRAKERRPDSSARPTPIRRVPEAARPLNVKRAFALSGGGAKGSFQVGALKFLYEERGLRPDIVVGTSVGSVNGVKLAEGETGKSKTAGHVTGFDGLEKSWLDIENNGDMYVEKSDFRKLKELAENADELAEALADSGVLSFVAALTAVFHPGPTHLALSGAAAATTISGLETLADAAALAERVFYLDGLVELEPVRKKLDSPVHLDTELVRNSGIEFRTVWVGMLSGKTYCTDQNRRLYELADPAKPIGIAPLRTSVLASAAQPLFMETPIVSGDIGGKAFKEKGFDGGVREIVGVQCAEKLGATEIYAILCQPLDNELAPTGEMQSTIDIEIPGCKKISKDYKYWYANTKQHRSLLTLAQRALDLTLTEVLENDLAAVRSADLHVIRPYLNVHDPMTLEPGLLRANMGHGWMCAYDLFHPAATGPVDFLRGGNLLITENRKWKEEYRVTKREIKRRFAFLPGNAFFVEKATAALNTAIHECNARIGQGIAMRRAIAPDSLPAGADGWDEGL